MIETPEALTLASQIKKATAGKTVVEVLPPTKPHKFCWFNGEAESYNDQLRGSVLQTAEGFGIFVELAFSNGRFLCINDGVNPRFLSEDAVPRDYQLRIVFSDGTSLIFTVAMYGGIYLHAGDYDNDYYLKSRAALLPSSGGFPAYYNEMFDKSKKNLSAKAFLAAEQRFPGIGNGVLQDILFTAGVHPKRKIGTLSQAEKEKLLQCAVSVLYEMTEAGGRDTERDLYGEKGGYKTKMSKNTLTSGCPLCGDEIVKEAYMGGSVYYCPHCQPKE